MVYGDAAPIRKTIDPLVGARGTHTRTQRQIHRAQFLFSLPLFLLEREHCTCEFQTGKQNPLLGASPSVRSVSSTERVSLLPVKQANKRGLE